MFIRLVTVLFTQFRTLNQPANRGVAGPGQGFHVRIQTIRDPFRFMSFGHAIPPLPPPLPPYTAPSYFQISHLLTKNYLVRQEACFVRLRQVSVSVFVFLSIPLSLSLFFSLFLSLFPCRGVF